MKPSSSKVSGQASSRSCSAPTWALLHRDNAAVYTTIPLDNSEITRETFWVEPFSNFALHRSEHRASLDEWNLACHEDLKLSITLPAETTEAIR